MRAMQFQGEDSPELVMVDQPEPEPGPHEVKVRITYAAINRRDVGLAQRSNPDWPWPLIPLSDAAAVVTAIGPEVTRFAIGDRVCPTAFQNWISGPSPLQRGVPNLMLGGALQGVSREFLCLHEDGFVRIPDTIGDLEAATLPCAALTAWNALFVAHNTKPGDLVLLQGTGGVSIAGLQFAKAAGAFTIITSSSDAKLARAASLGADVTVNHRTWPNWGERALALAGRPADVVLDVGGGETLPQTLAVLRPGGDICAIGALSGQRLPRVTEEQGRYTRISIGSREDFDDMLEAIQASAIRPVVDRVFGLEALGAALQAQGRGEFFGKVAIAVNP